MIFGFIWNGDAERERRDLVADSEAFLLGHLAERLEERGLGVPVWAWTNLLAHASDVELRAEITEAPKGRLGSRDWRRARAYLAAEVLSAAEAHGSLADLQTQVLHPIELSLAESLQVIWWRPSELALHINSVLALHRAAERNPSHSGRSQAR